MPVQCTIGFIPASKVAPGMKIRSNSKVTSNQGVYEVVSSQARAFDGVLLIRVQGKSGNGVDFRTTLAYSPDEQAEVVG